MRPPLRRSLNPVIGDRHLAHCGAVGIRPRGRPFALECLPVDLRQSVSLPAKVCTLFHAHVPLFATFLYGRRKGVKNAFLLGSPGVLRKLKKNWALLFSNEAPIARRGAEWIIRTLQLFKVNLSVALD